MDLYLRLIRLTLLFTFVLIIVGGATRVYDAGMACPDWPHCYGYYVPFPESKTPRRLHGGRPALHLVAGGAGVGPPRLSLAGRLRPAG